MRMSVIPVPDANGWTVGSRRQASSVKPNARATSSSNSFCGLEWELARRRLDGGGARGDFLDERRLMRLEIVEQATHLRCLHVPFEVVEHDVVGLVAHVEAVDVALAEIEVGSQDGQEAGEVVVLARVDPDGIRERGRARHLRAQLGRHATGLVPVARDDADQARLERVVFVLLAEVPQLVEQAPDLGRGELLVRDPADRRELLGANCGPAPRHHHLLVPRQQRHRLAEVADLLQPPLQLLERRTTHGRETYITRLERPAAGSEGKLRGRSPPPCQPRFERWRWTGSESTAERTRNPPVLSMGSPGLVALEQLQIVTR